MAAGALTHRRSATYSWIENIDSGLLAEPVIAPRDLARARPGYH